MEKFFNEKKFNRNSKYKRHTGPRVSNLMHSYNDNHHRTHRKKMKRYSHKVYRQELNNNLEDSKNNKKKHYSYKFSRSEKISDIIKERIEEKKMNDLNYVDQSWHENELSLYTLENSTFMLRFGRL